MNDQFDTSISTSLNLLEQGVSSGGDISQALREVHEELRRQNLNESQTSSYMQRLTQEAHSRRLFPALVDSYLNRNFNDFDLDSSGYVSSRELSRTLTSNHMSRSFTPMEQQIVRYMAANIRDIANGANDEVGRESTGISRRDSAGYLQQQNQHHGKYENARRMLDQFGTAQTFRRLDTNGNGYVSLRELDQKINSNTPLDGLNLDQSRTLLRFIKDNRGEIYRSSNDQRFFESEISLNDIVAFERNNRPAALPDSVASSTTFNNPQAPRQAESTTSFLPRLVLETGESRFGDLDHNGDRYISRAELDKVLDSRRWSSTFNASELRALNAMRDRIVEIQRSHNDEWGAENNGISINDLRAFARNEERNRTEIPSRPGDHIVTMNIAGRERRCLMHIPPSYDGTKPMPALVMLHGILQDGDRIASHTGFSEIADREGFIAIYPESLGWVGNNVRTWNVGRNSLQYTDDAQFVQSLLDSVKDGLNIDRRRIYLAGYSNGGMLAHELATRNPNEFAALATVSASMNGSEARPDSPVPVLTITSTNDWVVPRRGRSIVQNHWALDMEPSSRTVDFWRQTNRTDRLSTTEPNPGVTRRSYTGGPGSAEVREFTIQGGNHFWPGSQQPRWMGIVPDQRLNSSNEIWQFFSAQARPSDR